jgi:hypothetical protein
MVRYGQRCSPEDRVEVGSGKEFQSHRYVYESRCDTVLFVYGTTALRF